MTNSSNLNGCSNLEMQKVSLNSSGSADCQALEATDEQTPKKLLRNRHNLTHLPALGSANLKCNSTWVCKNLACKAIVSSEDNFCRRCSCCICHRFDDNKDPSLWLVCADDSNDKDCCGSSCHIECALQHEKVGCVTLGDDMNIDGSYCCAACGKVSGILGICRRQLAVARDCRRVDILCYRIFLSYKLLVGTSRLSELFQIIEDAKVKLENELGPLEGDSIQMAHGFVSRLPGGNDVQKLCSLAIEKADNLSASHSSQFNGDTLPAACRFRFEDITFTSVVVILREICSATTDSIKGYKLWYWKSMDGRHHPHPEPIKLMRDQRKILIFNLEACTEYTFRVISFTDDGNLGYSEAKCFTGSRDCLFKILKKDYSVAEGCSSRVERSQTVRSAGFKIRNVARILRQAWAKEGYLDAYCEDMDGDSCVGRSMASRTHKNSRAVSRRLDLNEIFVPDLNVEPAIPVDCPSDENRHNFREKKGVRRSSDTGCSKNYYTTEHVQRRGTMEVQSEGRLQSDDVRENSHAEDINMQQQKMHSTEDYEYCVKVIRWLECSGLLQRTFRMKFLTWLSFRSSEKERKVVVTYMRTLMDEPSILAGQLVDSFAEMISCKMPRSDNCSDQCH